MKKAFGMLWGIFGSIICVAGFGIVCLTGEIIRLHSNVTKYSRGRARRRRAKITAKNWTRAID
jgi:hypothetical protein